MSKTTRREQAKVAMTVASVPEFMKWVEALPQDSVCYFRGLQKTEYPLHSALYRRIQKHDFDTSLLLSRDEDPRKPSATSSPELPVPPKRFCKHIEKLLKPAQARRYNWDDHGREMHQLELLGNLQHHGAATPLIDFSGNPLVALWFACLNASEKGSAGIVWAVEEIPDGSAEDSIRTLTSLDAKDTIQTLLNLDLKDTQNSPTDQNSGTPDPKIYMWDSKYINPRNLAQNSVFLFSWPELEEIPNDQIRMHCCIISEIRKIAISKQLASMSIDGQNIFYDLPGYAMENAYDKPYRSSLQQYIKRIWDGFEKSKDAETDLLKQEAMESYPDNSKLLNLRGIHQVQQNKYNAAMEDFDKAIELDPNHAIAYINRGILNATLDKTQEAMADYGKAIELDPNNAEAYINRGILNTKLDKTKEAMADFDKAIELDPNNATSYIIRGIFNDNLDKTQEAMADFDKAIELDPNDTTAYILRGNLNAKLNKTQEAVAGYGKAIELDPNNATAYRNRGILNANLGKTQEAIVDFDKTIELDPNDAEAYINRAQIKEAMGDHAGAQEDQKTAERLGRNDKD